MEAVSSEEGEEEKQGETPSAVNVSPLPQQSVLIEKAVSVLTVNSTR